MGMLAVFSVIFSGMVISYDQECGPIGVVFGLMAGHGWVAWRPRSWSWWITLANLIGSIAFGISAVAGYINPVTGQVHHAGRANAQTLIGATCFLIGAILLLPERTEETHRQVTAPSGDSTCHLLPAHSISFLTADPFSILIRGRGRHTRPRRIAPQHRHQKPR
jgi:peptidoglycan/LPS O-acetylase OafA/YrhL